MKRCCKAICMANDKETGFCKAKKCIGEIWIPRFENVGYDEIAEVIMLYFEKCHPNEIFFDDNEEIKNEI